MRGAALANIFSGNEHLQSLPPVVGREIMMLLNKSEERRMSLFDLLDKLKTRPWFSSKAFYFALIFLFVTGLVTFDGAYVSVEQHASN